MIVAAKNDLTRSYSEFAAHSLIVGKNNYDGSPCTPTKLLCGFETVDLTARYKGKGLLRSDYTGDILLVITYNSGNVEQKFITLDFSANSTTLNAVTPAQILTALNARTGDTVNFEAYEYNAPSKNAINFRCKDPSVFNVQVYSDLANAIGFGGGRPFVGCGAKLFDFYNEDLATSIAEAPVMSEAVENQLLGMSTNGVTSVSIPARVTGNDFTVTVKGTFVEFEDVLRNRKRAFIPGQFGSTSVADQLVNFAEGALGGFCAWIPVNLYEGLGAQSIDDTKGVKINYIPSASFELQAPSGAAVSLTSKSFIIHAKQYTDDNGNSVILPTEETYQVPSQFLSNLGRAARNAPMQSMVNIIPVESAAIANVTDLVVGGSTSWVKVVTTPDNASGYEVALAEPADDALGCSFTFDPFEKLITIVSGETAGSETVTATITNRNQSVVTVTFTVTVAA
jgi:hypothetical protein